MYSDEQDDLEMKAGLDELEAAITKEVVESAGDLEDPCVHPDAYQGQHWPVECRAGVFCHRCGARPRDQKN